jgi:hypothetical protein
LRLSFLRAASILVLPVSKTPGVYLAERTAMYQFMAADNAIVAEYSPGVAGVLKDGHTVAIAKYGDVHSLAEKIELLIAHSDKAEELGRNTRKEVEEKYSWNALAPKAREIINRVARYGGPPSHTPETQFLGAGRQAAPRALLAKASHDHVRQTPPPVAHPCARHRVAYRPPKASERDESL